jgi:3-oxoacyl-[acyl-carrier protein] reductase
MTADAGVDAESLAGRTVLVTGSGRGLGAAIARAAGRAGARVTLNCQNDLRGAECLAAEIKAAGGQAVVCRADVTDHVQARQLVEEAVRAFGRVDVLVNAVGAFAWKPLADVEPAEWRAVFASNLDSVYNLCRPVLPHMRRQHFGRIVNLGAVGAENTGGQPQRAAYAAAKAGVIAFSRSLALEEARCGITVNVVSPGLLDDDGGGPGALLDRVPVGHGGRLEDVVRAVLFFASPAADFVTGQVLAVAGGARE